MAFDKMDKNCNGFLEVDDIRDAFNGRKHPDVLSGKKTEDEVLAEYLDTFEYHFTLLNNSSTKDRKISLEEFYEYYNYVSMSIDSDEYFSVMMNNCWNLDGTVKKFNKGWKSEV